MKRIFTASFWRFHRAWCQPPSLWTYLNPAYHWREFVARRRRRANFGIPDWQGLPNHHIAGLVKIEKQFDKDRHEGAALRDSSLPADLPRHFLDD